VLYESVMQRVGKSFDLPIMHKQVPSPANKNAKGEREK